MAQFSIAILLTGIAFALAGLNTQVEGRCVFEETQCQCAEIRSPGSECLRLEEGLGSNTSCVSVACNDGMQCSCTSDIANNTSLGGGFELCTVSSCPATLVAASGDPTPLGSIVECVSSTTTTGSTTATPSEKLCAKEIENDFDAVVKTVAAANSASTAAAALSTEADEIAMYATATETLLQQYSVEANGLLATIASVREARNSSPEEVAQLQALVDAVITEAAAATTDKARAEAEKVAVTASAAESERWNQRAIASDEYIERLNTEIPALQQQLEDVEDKFGLEAFVIAEQLRALIDFRDNEIYFLQDHAYEAGLHSRQARSTVRKSRVLYSANVERRSSGELKLQQCKDFTDSLTS